MTATIGKTTRTARAIIEVLRPLTGDPATGTATISASGADVEVPARSFLAPVRRTAGGNRKIDRDNLIRTRVATTVTSTGTAVGIISMLGGRRQNLPAGTVLRFDPPLTGVEHTTTVDALMTGGADATGVGAVKQILEYEQIESATAALDIFNAKSSGGAPCIVLGWDSSGPTEKIGRGVIIQPDRWTLFVIVARTDSSSSRRNEGRDISDAIRGYLLDRASVAGHVFSSPPTDILGRVRTAITQSSYIYAVQIETHAHPKRIETRAATSPDGEMTWEDWRRTHLDMRLATVPPFPIVDAIIPALEYDQTIAEAEKHLLVTDEVATAGGTKPLTFSAALVVTDWVLTQGGTKPLALSDAVGTWDQVGIKVT